jgi:DNA-binding beta-propeller fold protein YncE
MIRSVPWFPRLSVAALLSVVLLTMLAPSAASASPSKAASVTGTRISALGSGINNPGGVSSDGSDVWVTNSNGGAGSGSVTELDASTGAVIQVIKAKKYGFAHPYGVSSDGIHVWVTNFGDNSVTEFDASTGALVQVIKGVK